MRARDTSHAIAAGGDPVSPRYHDSVNKVRKAKAGSIAELQRGASALRFSFRKPTKREPLGLPFSGLTYILSDDTCNVTNHSIQRAALEVAVILVFARKLIVYGKSL